MKHAVGASGQGNRGRTVGAPETDVVVCHDARGDEPAGEQPEPKPDGERASTSVGSGTRGERPADEPGGDRSQPERPRDDAHGPGGGPDHEGCDDVDANPDLSDPDAPGESGSDAPVTARTAAADPGAEDSPAAPGLPTPRAGGAPAPPVTIELRLPRVPPPAARSELPMIRVEPRRTPPPRAPRVVRPEPGAELTPRVERLGGGAMPVYRHRLPRQPEPLGVLRGEGGPPSRMDPRLTCCMLATAALEVIGGSRPLAQLSRWVSPAIYDALEQRRRLGDAGPGPEPLLARTVAGRPRPVVQRVRAMRIDDRIVESSVVLQHAGRFRAVAIRLVEVRGVWRAEALVVG
ncbi:Rv3235 family protein [Cellulomonas denverensis]|uniref:Uncharacterized protein n=1 Tax=Cellulomonas denverensis TaxID=264297 RepID=A0A7X6QYW9_9CELL|nr:Rv3235 family protein [Cellulomonas denverensis]NKY22568.1 hypothetical protein [Cellulomonas denverensis]GIG24787.1 hypothetical protein Cde04nite_10310 [Cellulomonas denverensis]